MQKGPDSERLRVGLNLAYYANVDYDWSISNLSDVLSSDPKDTLATELLGRACTAFAEGSNPRCAVLIIPAEIHSNATSLATYAAASILHKEGETSNLEIARQFLQRAIKESPELAQAHFALEVLLQLRTCRRKYHSAGYGNRAEVGRIVLVGALMVCSCSSSELRLTSSSVAHSVPAVPGSRSTTILRRFPSQERRSSLSPAIYGMAGLPRANRPISSGSDCAPCGDERRMQGRPKGHGTSSTAFDRLVRARRQTSLCCAVSGISVPYRLVKAAETPGRPKSYGRRELPERIAKCLVDKVEDSHPLHWNRLGDRGKSRTKEPKDYLTWLRLSPQFQQLSVLDTETGAIRAKDHVA